MISPALPARLSRKPFPLVLALVSVVLQCVGLYSPGGSTPIVLPIPHLDKIVHVGLFAVPVFLLLWAGVRHRVVLPLAALQVLASELIQARWVPNRTGDWQDALADLIGIGLGVLAAWWFRRAQTSLRR
ncbi:MAG: hypothetical protein Q4G46_08725 [Propionibacteriaceae bacterium]|nr:hypothetical protein [Propionibacteriaceae bacterium]